MKELDKRYKMKLDRNNTKTPLKERVLGPASSSLPPSGAPNWAIDPSWINNSGKKKYN